MNQADQNSAIKALTEEAEQIPKKINPKKSTPRFMIMKLLKTKDKKCLNTEKNQHIS